MVCPFCIFGVLTGDLWHKTLYAPAEATEQINIMNALKA